MTQGQVKIHGGVRFVGPDSEVSNLTLEIESIDPNSLSEGHVWYNTVEERVKYVESKNNQMTTRALANLDDLKADRQLVVMNGGSRSLVFGQPVYSALSGIDSASAGNSEKRTVIGLVCENEIGLNVEGRIQFRDVLSGTVSQWTEVTGSPTGLVPGQAYFLSVESGKLTYTPPTTEGQNICYVGRAISNTDLFVDIQRPIAL